MESLRQNEEVEKKMMKEVIRKKDRNKQRLDEGQKKKK